MIRSASPQDTEPLAGIALASGHPSWTAQRFTEELALERTRALVTEVDGAIAGFAIGWQVMDELELHLIAIDPALRRRGLGNALLAAFEALSPVVHLEVSVNNAGALALYRGRGYAEIGRRPDYYGPGETAVLMRHIRR
jgi:[ribosomal protein S18]-alanine N-acetyltransferase